MNAFQKIIKAKRWKWWLIDVAIFILVLLVLYIKAREILRPWIPIGTTGLLICYTLRLTKVRRLNKFDWIALKLFPIVSIAVILTTASVNIQYPVCEYTAEISKEQLANLSFQNNVDFERLIEEKQFKNIYTAKASFYLVRMFFKEPKCKLVSKEEFSQRIHA